ncbi:hypothetical protein QMK33_22075 [Hymenobacter sp. H14-R3]|uniref:hypothetical protein n=1 Tax=Hymenobacter sp. H14-R3 TaxID=3046308 RepID=UPI0024BAC017|nr:hypothetical protein [Hymenobacter sp. H14-R3]MDJ0367842.1 hypothetical protein [Hymenobacter sp. H14-R3]
MPSPDKSLAAFRQAYFGAIDSYLAWHDGFQYHTDLAGLDALTPAQQQQAAEELLAGLRAGTADARAMLGLGHLRYAEALPLLHQCLRQSFATYYALQAIAQINPAGFYPPVVAGLLADPTKQHQYLDLDLVIGLRECFTLPQLGPLIPPLIFALLANKDNLVRSHALHGVRLLSGSATAAQLADYNPQRIKADEVFQLLVKNKEPQNFCRAQQLLLTQLPPETVATFLPYPT